jgi:hypothetical protein
VQIKKYLAVFCLVTVLIGGLTIATPVNKKVAYDGGLPPSSISKMGF